MRAFMGNDDDRIVRGRAVRRLLVGLLAIGAAQLASGCQLLVSFDRSRIVSDAGVSDGGLDSGAPIDAGPADAADSGPVDAPASDSAIDAPAMLDAGADAPDMTDAPPMLDAGADAPDMTDAPPMLDAGADAPDLTDASVDGGPMCGVCGGPTPICDTSDGMCVECLVVSDCTASGGCVGRTCVECDANADCGTVAASACNVTTNVCQACAADGDCTHLGATPVCNEAAGRCVACTADTEAARCGANSCILSTGTCSTTPRTSRGACEACAADSECMTAGRCVSIAFGAAPAATHCLFEVAGGCGDTVAAREPYTAMTTGTSLGGVAGPFCAPPATTSCAGVRDLELDTTCTVDANCGIAGQADGRCLAAGTCSYSCATSSECPGAILCDGASMLCDGP